VISLLTRRFSAVSLICVSILIGSGAINSLPLVGAIHNLWLTDYGRLLLIKIFLAYLMVALGAMNLRCWKPRLLLDSEGNMQGNRDHAAKKLQQNVMMEIALACLVVLVVGLLGLLPPASEHSHHAHDPSSVEARPLAPSSN
jgi:putative copper export protein